MRYGPEFVHILLLLSVPVGMICCFLGYKAFKFVLGIFGFVAGLFIGNILVVTFFEFDGLVMWIIVIVGGILGAGLSVSLYFFGIFVTGAVAGGLLGSVISTEVTVEPIIVILVMGLIFGILALVVQKLIIIVSTALAGAWMAVSGGAYFLGGFNVFRFFQEPSSAWESFRGREVLLIGWLLLSGLGMLVQFRSRTREKRKSGKNNDG